MTKPITSYKHFKKIIFASFISGILLLPLFSFSQSEIVQQTNKKNYVEGEILIKYKDNKIDLKKPFKK
jgi:hypothetical protein